MRSYTIFDKFCLHIDQGLRTLTGNVQTTGREHPAQGIKEGDLSEKETRHAAGLMRINHVGEICAQALYQGQALTAKSDSVKNAMQQAAAEENDHLQWCEDRLTELDSHTSYLNPLWYIGSYTIGAIAGALGDKWSLGFVVETERQVEEHLDGHLHKLPPSDFKSRAIVAQMKIDEAKHADKALECGGTPLPDWIKTIMRFKAKVMTSTAYWL